MTELTKTNLQSKLFKKNPQKATTGGEFDPARTVGLSLSQRAKDKPCQAVLIPYPVGFVGVMYA